MNTSSWEPLSGTSTLLAVHQDPTGYAPADGAGLSQGGQLLVTEDSIQVIDLRVVRALAPLVPLVPLSEPALERTTWTTEITRSTCMAITPGCMCAENLIL